MIHRSLLFGRRRYFADVRTNARRLGVSSHPSEGVVVLSLWQGDTCTSTFRLPVADAPALIGELAEALGDAVGQPPSPDGVRSGVTAASGD